MCNIHLCNLKSHFWRDVRACCTRPVSMHLVMACVSCLFDSFSIFLLCSTQQQNLIKIMFSCIHFPVWPYPPPPPPPKKKKKKKLYFIQVNCMGWQVYIAYFWTSTKGVYLQCCLAVWLQPHETAAVCVHFLCTPGNHASVYSVISLKPPIHWAHVHLVATCQATMPQFTVLLVQSHIYSGCMCV